MVANDKSTVQHDQRDPKVEKMAAVVENQKEAVARMIDQAVASSKDINYPKTDFQLENHPIDEVRPLKVAVIGGGLSGILAGIMLPLKVPGIQLKIFEKNKDLVSVSLSRRRLNINIIYREGLG